MRKTGLCTAFSRESPFASQSKLLPSHSLPSVPENSHYSRSCAICDASNMFTFSLNRWRFVIAVLHLGEFFFPNNYTILMYLAEIGKLGIIACSLVSDCQEKFPQIFHCESDEGPKFCMIHFRREVISFLMYEFSV